MLEAVDRVCPLLALHTDGRSVVDGVDAGHRCHAERPPLPLDRHYQASVCLTAGHERCERFIQYATRAGASQIGRTSVGGGFVSTRMVLAPQPAWRGVAGSARRAGRGRVLAAAASAVLIAAGSAAAASAIGSGRLDLAAILAPAPPEAPADAAEGSQAATLPRDTASTVPSSSPSPTAAPTATVAPTSLATPSPTADPPAASASAPPTYVVQEGDTLALIAERTGRTVQALQEANGIADPDTIEIGQVLVLP